MRGDPKTRAEFYKALWAAGGAQSGNEIREWEDLDPIEGGERYFVQQGFMPLDKVDEVLARRASNRRVAPHLPIRRKARRDRRTLPGSRTSPRV
jgi:hypothetical protein